MAKRASKAKEKDGAEADPQEGRGKALERTLVEIGRRYGKETIRRLGDNYVSDVEVISTGSLALDAALGVGGLPRGRVVEIYGPESSGKTTLTLHAIANCQRTGGTAAFIDAEHALDPVYARKLGVQLENLLVSQPDCGEQALEIADLLVRSNAVDIIVIDSVAALVPRSEIEGEMGASSVGVQARLMSQALRKLTGIVKKSNTCVIFINQIRMKIGVMFGSPETTSGGNALKFYSSVRLDIRRTGTIKQDEVPVGNQVKVKVVKNKCAAPFRVATFEVLFNKGINSGGELVDLASERKVIEKAGAWLSYAGTRLGQGRDRACQFLEENPALRAEIAEKLREILYGDAVKTPSSSEAEETETGEAENGADSVAAEPEEEVLEEAAVA